MMDRYKELSRQSFERQAAVYDSSSCSRHARALYPALLAQLEHQVRSSLLDVGCGTGALLAEILDRFPETACTGVDLSEHMLSRAEERLNRLTALRQGDAEALPFPDASFEAVLCNDSFHHYPHPEKAVSEIARVLRPGGLFLLGDCTAPEPARRLCNLLLPFGRGGDVRLYSAGEIRGLLSPWFHDAECRRVGVTSLMAQGVRR